MTSCSVCRVGGRGRSRGMFGVMAFVFPSHCYTWWSPAFLGMAGSMPGDRKEWMNFFFCLLACLAFALPIKLPLSQSLSFLTFTLPTLSPIPPGWKWVSGCLVLSGWLGVNHNTTRMCWAAEWHHVWQSPDTVLVSGQCLEPAYKSDTSETHQNHPSCLCNTTYSYQTTRIPNNPNSLIQIKFPSAEWGSTHPGKLTEISAPFLIPRTEASMIQPVAEPAVLISAGRHGCPCPLETEHLGICSSALL